MKKYSFLLLAFAIPFFCLASFSLEQWKFYKDIETKSSDSGLIRFALDEELFENSKADLSDLRIVDEKKSEVPFKISEGKSEGKQESFWPRMINNSFSPGENSSVILDTGGNGKIVNRIKVETSSVNFQRNITVFGSSNQEAWRVLEKDAYIFDYTDYKGNAKTQSTAVDFPDSTFRYLKLEISDPEKKPVQISKVEAIYILEKRAREIERKPQYFVSQNEEKKETEVIIDSGSKGIPVSKIFLSATDKNFDRQIAIYSSNDKSNWNYIKAGYIFKYNTDKFLGTNCFVDFSETNDRYIKAVVKNGDNQPLSINEIKTFYNYREMVFQQEAEKKYRVFYGNPKARWPEYDFEKYFKYFDLGKSRLATLSSEKENPAYVPEKEPEKPLTERIPFLITGAFMLFTFILILIAYGFLKKK